MLLPLILSLQFWNLFEFVELTVFEDATNE